MLKRDAHGGSRRLGVALPSKHAGKNLTLCAVPALHIALLAVLLLFGSVVAVSTASAAEQETGERIFAARCAMCHGQDGSGNTTMGKSLAVPDLRSAAIQQQADAYLAEVIGNGTGRMPPFKNSLSHDQISTLVAQVRELGQKK
jgi:mono/diheme cytochrome c family protein